MTIEPITNFKALSTHYKDDPAALSILDNNFSTIVDIYNNGQLINNKNTSDVAGLSTAIATLKQLSEDANIEFPDLSDGAYTVRLNTQLFHEGIKRSK